MRENHLTKSVFQIDATKDRLFEIIADFNRWNEWFPSCKEAKIVTENGSSVQVEITLAPALGLPFDPRSMVAVAFCTKCRTRPGISSRLSRNGGNVIGKTLSR